MPNQNINILYRSMHRTMGYDWFVSKTSSERDVKQKQNRHHLHLKHTRRGRASHNRKTYIGFREDYKIPYRKKLQNL